MGHDQTEDLRADYLARITSEKRAACIEQLLAGDPATMHRIEFGLSDYLSGSQILSSMVAQSQHATSADIGRMFKAAVDAVIDADAAEEAEIVVQKIEKIREEQAREARIERRVWNHYFAHPI